MSTTEWRMAPKISVFTPKAENHNQITKLEFGDLTTIKKKDFGYDEESHFLDFLNERPSKWEFLYKQILPSEKEKSLLVSKL